ncbi:MAG: hypothetical protein WC483_00310 [Candidatus Paceibacterota bacterium]
MSNRLFVELSWTMNWFAELMTGLNSVLKGKRWVFLIEEREGMPSCWPRAFRALLSADRRSPISAVA